MVRLIKLSYEEALSYKSQYESCMIGEGKLEKTDTVVLAKTNHKELALFIYEENGNCINDFCIVSLTENKQEFMIGFRKMVRFFRGKYEYAYTSVEKSSHIVAWCDKLYERVGEDEEAFYYNIMKSIRRK